MDEEVMQLFTLCFNGPTGLFVWFILRRESTRDQWYCHLLVGWQLTPLLCLGQISSSFFAIKLQWKPWPHTRLCRAIPGPQKENFPCPERGIVGEAEMKTTTGQEFAMCFSGLHQQSQDPGRPAISHCRICSVFEARGVKHELEGAPKAGHIGLCSWVTVWLIFNRGIFDCQGITGKGLIEFFVLLY